MESFFIQKRFLLTALKPELMLKEENSDLRYEINRKDELIKKHYERIEFWKNMLADQQQQQHPPPHPPHMPPSQVPGMPPIGHAGMPPSDLRPMPMGMPPKNAPGPMNMGGMTSAMQVNYINRIDARLLDCEKRIVIWNCHWFLGSITSSAYATAATYDASPTNATNASKLCSPRAAVLLIWIASQFVLPRTLLWIETDIADSYLAIFFPVSNECKAMFRR